LAITLRYEYANVLRKGAPLQPITQPLRPGALPYPEVGDKNINDTDYNRAPVFSRDTTGLRNSTYVADIRYDMLGGELVSTTAWRRQHALVQIGGAGPSNNLTYFQHANQHYRQFSQELRFAGTYGGLDVNFGGYFERDKLKVNQLQYFFLGGFGVTGPAATPIGRVAYFDQITRKYSGFMDTTYRLNDQLSISAGIRYSRSEKRAGQSIFGINIAPYLGFDTDRAYLDGYRSPAIDALLGPVLGTTVHDFPFGRLRRDEDFWQPQVIAQYKFDDNMLYAKYVKGDKAGGFDFLFAGADPDAMDFGSEKAESYEIGLKGLILDRKLDYAVTAFHTVFSDLQQSVYRDTTFVVSNVGKARTQGIELEFNYRPIDGLRLAFNGAYLDAKILDFPGAACGPAQNLVTPRNCTQDLSGARQPFASRWNAYVAVDYERPVGRGDYIVGGGVSLFARTKFNADSFNDATIRQKGFAQLDAHLDLKAEDGKWALSLFGRNLTNVQFLEFALLAPGQNTATLGTYSRGRQIGLRLSTNFR
jgi:outer membrane receptor protein involved in Fe transport